MIPGAEHHLGTASRNGGHRPWPRLGIRSEGFQSHTSQGAHTHTGTCAQTPAYPGKRSHITTHTEMGAHAQAHIQMPAHVGRHPHSVTGQTCSHRHRHTPVHTGAHSGARTPPQCHLLLPPLPAGHSSSFQAARGYQGTGWQWLRDGSSSRFPFLLSHSEILQLPVSRGRGAHTCDFHSPSALAKPLGLQRARPTLSSLAPGGSQGNDKE